MFGEVTPNPSHPKWTPRQQRFIHWLLLPEGKRNPKTREELARALKVRQETLTRWEKLPGWNQALEDAAIQRLNQRTAKVMEVIGEKAEAGEFNFAKLLFELNEKFKQRYGEAAILFTSEEFTQALEDVEIWESERFGEFRGDAE